MIVFEVPVRTISETNAREHWASRHRRRAGQRYAATLLARSHVRGVVPVEVRLVRLAPRKLDSDNLAGACKAIRDGVADALGIDDGDERITWTYGQERRAAYGVRVEVRS